ncbi:MAG: chemotaxis protein [Pseudorhodoplanes sp.]|nr:chemotaxis protein [Pseudorhodoplanes sp.]GIK79201.1 MAG: hypothetical protein BroJett024_03060 [Alphaproteobacteria bacterium]
MNQLFGLTIESLVAVLLLLTILYCARLNARLKLLKADESAMKATIVELVNATESAERAIAGLRLTVKEAEETLGLQLRDADAFNLAMTENLRAGEDVLGRLRKIAHAGRLLNAERDDGAVREAPVITPPMRPGAEPASDTASIVAAAQAFAERNRSRMDGLAA